MQETLIYIFGEMYKRKSVVTMPGAVGLEYSTDKGFDVAPPVPVRLPELE